MLNYWLNRCHIKVQLEIPGPVLVKDVRYDRNELVKRGIIPGERRDRYPDSTYVCHEGMTEFESAVLNRRFNQLTPYLPSTSIAGMLRCQTELVFNRLNQANGFPLVCDPYIKDVHAQSCHCADRVHSQASGGTVDQDLDFYRHSCPSCRLFGNRLFRGPVAVEDADLARAVRKSKNGVNLAVRRTGGIDRITGGLATGTLATVQAVEKTEYTCQLVITNFELWHLGWLVFLLRDLEQGEMAIGSHRSLGFGKIIGQIKEIRVSYFGPAMEQKKRLLGIAELLPHRRYDFLIPCEDKIFPDLLSFVETKGLEHRFMINDLETFKTWTATQWKLAMTALVQQRKIELRLAATEK